MAQVISAQHKPLQKLINVHDSYVAWKTLMKWLPQDSVHKDWWWKRLGGHLHVLLHEAGYNLNEQYEALLFLYYWVAPRMGPMPNSPQPVWRSFMTDDHSPIEYSWKWSPGDRAPEVRYSIEAIGDEAGSREDPMNQASTVDLLQQLNHFIPELDLVWFEHFRRTLLGPGTPAAAYPDIGNSSVFLAFEMVHGRIRAKAYFLPVETPQLSAAQQISDAICKSGCSNLEAVHCLESYLLQSDAQGNSIRPFMLGIDCVKPAESRLKIYARSPETSFNFVHSVMTLGGRREGLDGVVGDFHELWKLTLGLAPDEPPENSLSRSSHQTSGTLFYFDVAPKSPIPDVKTYIPVRHYAQSDLQAARGLLGYLESRNSGLHAKAYIRCLEALESPEGLESTTGVQTYITVAFERDGLSITSYLNPQIYRPSRWFP
ncbi:hypothetical protein TCE0_034f12102 [Talaromyces pinophilus]|jgi:4-O-dimethylallyl-L-tyrosine synthase|uniref:Uncharacterized protein n=1 Tax=Talaromyces pinophilus TaxID=128442 RepID=A0A6V8HGJ7_TALPI|nr:hypothetical protein TCE0_034f12102 [Talaromyces pinophilus]